MDAQDASSITSIAAQCPEILSFRLRTFHDGVFGIEFVPRSSSSFPLRDSDRVKDWNEVFDDFFDGLPSGSIESVSRHGWISSYTKQLVTEAEFDEWIQNWETTIIGLRPKVALEIGCGIGTVMARIAPQCATYVAIDTSPAAIARLRPIASRDYPTAEVLCASAHELSKVPAHAYDTIILNSVIQYFPNESYLREVLDGCVGLIGASGGNIFIGDIRNLALAREFHLSVIAAHEPLGTGLPEVERQLYAKIANDVELQLDVEWFHRYCASHPNVSGLLVRPKRCRLKTELSAYRYDVILQVGSFRGSFLPQERLNLTDLSSAADVLDRLSTSFLSHPVIADVCDALLVSDIALLNALSHYGSGATLASLGQASPPRGVPCGDLVKLASKRGMAIDVRLLPHSLASTYQVLLSNDHSFNIQDTSDLIATPQCSSIRALCSDPNFSVAALVATVALQEKFGSQYRGAIPQLLPVPSLSDGIRPSDIDVNAKANAPAADNFHNEKR